MVRPINPIRGDCEIQKTGGNFHGRPPGYAVPFAVRRRKKGGAFQSFLESTLARLMAAWNLWPRSGLRRWGGSRVRRRRSRGRGSGRLLKRQIGATERGLLRTRADD